MTHKDKEEIMQIIAATHPEDYDGHTDFGRLSPMEKLRWLCHTSFFVYTMAKNNPELGCNRLFPH